MGRAPNLAIPSKAQSNALAGRVAEPGPLTRRRSATYAILYPHLDRDALRFVPAAS